MGIDAHMVIRNVPRTLATLEWLKEKSFRLCESIGAKHFFISDGLAHAEYEAASKAWHARFDAHRLAPDFKLAQQRGRWPSADESWREIREKIVADIGEHSIKEMRLAIEPVGIRYRDEGDPEPGTAYRDDGSVELVAQSGECLLQVNLWGRYYGPGYERGDILIYCAIAEWLELNIVGCEVWYGGDSSGVNLRRFDSAYRQELREHLYSPDGRNYFRYDSWCGNISVRPSACSLCPSARYHGSQYGAGSVGKYMAFHCAGCGKSVKTEDGGQTWTDEKADS